MWETDQGGAIKKPRAWAETIQAGVVVVRRCRWRQPPQHKVNACHSASINYRQRMVHALCNEYDKFGIARQWCDVTSIQRFSPGANEMSIRRCSRGSTNPISLHWDSKACHLQFYAQDAGPTCGCEQTQHDFTSNDFGWHNSVSCKREVYCRMRRLRSILFINVNSSLIPQYERH